MIHQLILNTLIACHPKVAFAVTPSTGNPSNPDKTTETKITDTTMAGINIALMFVEFPLALAWMAGTGSANIVLNNLMGPIDDIYYQIEKMAKARIGELGIFVAGGSTYDTQAIFRLGDGVVGRSDSEGEVGYGEREQLGISLSLSLSLSM